MIEAGEDLDPLIKELYLAIPSKTLKQIAEELGRSEGYVEGRLRSMKKRGELEQMRRSLIRS